MRKIKVALIGYNKLSHAQAVWGTFKKYPEIFDVYGYALPENEREKFPELMNQFDGYKELTLDEILNNPEIEAVAVETEEIYLTKYASLAAKAGKHIHMEKPGGTDLEEFEELISLVKKSDKVFHTGYMYRYNPAIIKLLEEVKNGELGDIISVEAQMNCFHPTQNRQWLETFPGGMMFFLGCHLVDIIYSILGTPDKVIPLNRSSGVDGVTAEDFGMAVFEYKNGISFAKTSAVEPGGFTRRQIVVTGSKKTVEINPIEVIVKGSDQYTTVTEKKDPKTWADNGTTENTEIFNRYDPMLISFAQMVAGEKKNSYTPDYELEVYKLTLKACGK